MPKKKSVAVLDDDQSILDIVSLVLAEASFKVQAFSDPQKFIQQMEQTPADVVIVDIFIDGTDGRRVCRDLKSRSRTSQMPVLLMSADHYVGELAQSAGADAWIEKPFDIDELVNIVERYAH